MVKKINIKRKKKKSLYISYIINTNKMVNAKNIMIYLDYATIDKLYIYSKRSGLSRSAFITWLIDNYTENSKPKNIIINQKIAERELKINTIILEIKDLKNELFKYDNKENNLDNVKDNLLKEKEKMKNGFILNLVRKLKAEDDLLEIEIIAKNQALILNDGTDYIELLAKAKDIIKKMESD